MLMEEVDGPLERLEEQVDRIFVSTLSSNLLSAIAARLSRQEEQATEVHILELEVETEREAFETRIMMTSCTPLEFHLSTLVVTEIETEGWKLLASGLEAHTGIQQVHTKKKNNSNPSKELSSLLSAISVATLYGHRYTWTQCFNSCYIFAMCYRYEPKCSCSHRHTWQPCQKQ